MNKLFRRKVLIFLVLPIMLACSLPGGLFALPPAATLGPTDVAATINAAVAQTATQMALIAPPTQTPSRTISPTVSVTATITLTPTFSVTPSPRFTPTQTLTSTPEIPLINVSVNTNCRNGPGKVYDNRGALMVTQTAEVLAGEPTGKYWLIQNPDNPKENCWVWGTYATIVGNTAALPVYTPPPTPTPPPSFSLDFDGLDNCVGWYPRMKVKNTGPVTFQSAQIKVNDKDTATIINYSTNAFDQATGCVTALSIATLGPGVTGYVQGYAFAYDPTGHNLTATVKLCTELNQGGVCTSKSLDFKP